MPTIELLIGMIGSGKSTYARSRAKEGALVVSHDDLTAMLHAEYRYEQGLREVYRRMEEAIVAEAIVAGRDAVIDRTHLTRESRARWVAFKNNATLPADSWRTLRVVAVTFPVWPAHVHATRRHHADARGRSFLEWHQVATHHAEQAQAEPLDWQAEGFAELKAIDVPPWPAGLSEQTADYLMRQP
jgi:predicted kinase